MNDDLYARKFSDCISFSLEQKPHQEHVMVKGRRKRNVPHRMAGMSMLVRMKVLRMSLLAPDVMCTRFSAPSTTCKRGSLRVGSWNSNLFLPYRDGCPWIKNKKRHKLVR
jgi:hypothetical protein